MMAEDGAVPSLSDDVLLGESDPPAVSVLNAGASGRFLLVGDHAGSVIPRRLGTLGLGAADLARHIAIDIGVARLGERLSAMLDAPFVAQRYSRLVIDCNRRLDAPDSIAEVSDGTVVPGNEALSQEERTARVAAIHAPYQAAIAGRLAARAEAGLPTALIALHSFTPSMRGVDRPWQMGVLHHLGNNRFAQALLAELQALPGWCIGDNEPYAMDKIDYTVPLHAYPAGLPYAEIEVRQDLLGDEAGIARIADVLAAALVRASG